MAELATKGGLAGHYVAKPVRVILRGRPCSIRHWEDGHVSSDTERTAMFHQTLRGQPCFIRHWEDDHVPTDTEGTAMFHQTQRGRPCSNRHWEDSHVPSDTERVAMLHQTLRGWPCFIRHWERDHASSDTEMAAIFHHLKWEISAWKICWQCIQTSSLLFQGCNDDYSTQICTRWM